MKILAMRKLVAFVLCLQVAFGTAAVASDSSPSLQGTWVGTIGSAKVRFCITADDEFSSYYYEKYQKKISITVDSKTLQINELTGKSFSKEGDEVTAHMKLKRQNDQLTGTWINNARRLNIRLTKQKNNSQSGSRTEIRETFEMFGCDEIFYEPIVTRFLATRKFKKGVKEYPIDILSISADQTDADMGYDPTYLKFIYPMLRWAVVNSYELSIRDYEFWTSMHVEYESAEYLSMSEYGRGWGGGAHPGSYINGFLFRKDGRLMDVGSMLKVDALESPGKILALFVKEVEALALDCEINMSELSVRVHAPTKNGLSFAPDGHNDLSDCSLPQTIPWSEIQPYLSNTGLRVMRDFIR